MQAMFEDMDVYVQCGNKVICNDSWDNVWVLAFRYGSCFLFPYENFEREAKIVDSWKY